VQPFPRRVPSQTLLAGLQKLFRSAVVQVLVGAFLAALFLLIHKRTFEAREEIVLNPTGTMRPLYPWKQTFG